MVHPSLNPKKHVSSFPHVHLCALITSHGHFYTFFKITLKYSLKTVEPTNSCLMAIGNIY